MKKLLGIALVVALAAAAINDIGRYATTAYNLGETTGEIARYAADRVRTTGASREVIGSEAATFASQRGIEVTAYDHNASQVVVQTRASVNGTWVLAPGLALMNGQPKEAPLYVKDDDTVILQ